MRARNPLYIMAKPPPAQQALITALPRNDPGRGPHLLHVTLVVLFDLHYARPSGCRRSSPRSTASTARPSRSPSTGSRTARP